MEQRGVKYTFDGYILLIQCHNYAKKRLRLKLHVPGKESAVDEKFSTCGNKGATCSCIVG